jgi:hypothetical protein
LPLGGAECGAGLLVLEQQHREDAGLDDARGAEGLPGWFRNARASVSSGVRAWPRGRAAVVRPVLAGCPLPGG